MFSLVFANKEGKLFDYPGLAQTGRLGNRWVEPLEEEFILLPEGATLTMIPGRYPIGMDPGSGQFQVMSKNPYDPKEEVWAVGALLPQGYTRSLLPGFARQKEDKPLPLLGYTAVGFKNGRFFAAALPTDEDNRWNPRHYNTRDLEAIVDARLMACPENRVLRQLAKCSLEYGCFTAQNIFYGRWEGGIPSSPVCNAQCLGCISLQPSECCPSPQNRIEFVPRAEEIVEIGLAHLSGDDAIISFGQGCEGEPSLQAPLLAQAIGRIRSETSAGTININTNAGHKDGIKKLAEAGLDSMRVSIISPTPEIYNAYYRPRGYSMEDVKFSLAYAADQGVHTSLNLLTFPGVTDREEEVEALIDFVAGTGVKLIQIRNLNIDPDVYLEAIPEPQGEALGIPALLEMLSVELPEVRIGNYSKPTPRNTP